MQRLIIAILILATLTSCAEISILNTFNGGELSPHMDARVDFQKYNSGLRTLENFICLPYGGALKRSGTQYIADTKSDGVARLAPFSVGVDQTYIMEIGVGYIRFYQNGVQLTTSSVPIEVTTPYVEADLFEIQISQFADTLYMAHPDHPPQKLQRTTTAPTFTFAEVDWAWPPVLDENITSTTITPSGTTGTVTLTASDAIFTTDHTNSTWVLNSPNTNNATSLDLSANGTSDVIRIEGDWNLRTSGGPFEGALELQVSLDDEATWGTFRKYENDNTQSVNFDRDGTEVETGVKYRLVFTEVGTSTGTAYLKNEEPYVNGTVKITGFNSSTVVTGTVVNALGSTDAVKTWSEGAFSEERGFPRTVEFFENRLFFGGTEYQVNTLWISKTDDYENFQTGTFDDSGMRISISSDNIIEWMLGRNQLFIGTLGDEWILSGGDSNTAITPTSILARRQTSFGSRDGIDALIASDSIMYLQRQGLKLREFEFSFESDSYKSVDDTMLAEHITKGGVVQIAEQQQPEPIIWCVRGDGQLLGMTYSKDQNVNGWHRHITDGTFESVAVIPTTGEDRVYVVVNRDNGRYVEWFRPIDWGSDDKDAWFVDSGLDYDGGDAVTFSLDVSTNGNITVTAANSLSDGDHVRLDDIISTNDLSRLNEATFAVTNTTATNFTLMVADESALYVYSPEEITVSTAGSISRDVDVPQEGYRGDRAYYRFLDADANESIAVEYVTAGALWQISGEFPTATFNYRNLGTDALPPKAGYTVILGDAPAPTIAYDTTATGTVMVVKQVFTNVTHLASATLNIFADGGVVPDQTVTAGGVLTTDEYYNRVIAGLPYSAKLSPMHIDVVNNNTISYGKTKNPYKVHFRLNKSGAFNYGSASNSTFAVSVRPPTLTAGSPVPFFTGDRGPIVIDGAPKTNPEFWVTSEEPLPLELLSLTLFTKITEME